MLSSEMLLLGLFRLDSVPEMTQLTRSQGAKLGWKHSCTSRPCTSVNFGTPSLLFPYRATAFFPLVDVSSRRWNMILYALNGTKPWLSETGGDGICWRMLWLSLEARNLSFSIRGSRCGRRSVCAFLRALAFVEDEVVTVSCICRDFSKPQMYE
ncbi:hypothetical protein B0H16DRAFT_1601777 [Mycena metata]|uniref:Uncharacterized protein n=1 Tax=Mycena metata TaxID=1033252 RepID=A0AAD7MKH8_9AGAR|nr:hypothetical protein B0H16DRAFT_1601777 [Mycena metata]